MKKETKMLLGVGVVVALYFILKPKGLKPTPSEGDCCKMNPHPIGCTGCEGGRTPTPTNDNPIVSNECFFDLIQIEENILNSTTTTETYLSKKTNQKYTKIIGNNASVQWTDGNGNLIETSKWESEENCGKQQIIMN